MIEIMQIMKLMEQAPNFSMFVGALFIYFSYYYIKNQSKETILSIVKLHFNLQIEPIKTDLSQVKNDTSQVKNETSQMNARLSKIEQNICAK